MGRTVSHLTIVEASQGFILCGASTPDKAEELGSAVLQYTDGATTHTYAWDTLVAHTARPISTQYLHNVKHPLQSGHWHLWKGASQENEVSVVDWYTFLYPESRQAVKNQLLTAFRRHTPLSISGRGDIPDAFRAAFPVLSGHGLTHLIGDDAWQHVKQDQGDTLNLPEQRIKENRETGRSFEAFFQQLCRENGLDATPYSTAKLRDHYPGVAARLEEKYGGLNGMPDFFVTAPATGRTRSQVWAPTGQHAFVEVKYNQSRVTGEQETMLQALARHGIETWVFNGTENHYRFHRVEPRDTYAREAVPRQQ